MSIVRIDRRFRGPDESANGGYAAGLLASLLGGPVEVTLRLPPPLARDLRVERRDGGAVLLDGDAIVAEAAPAGVDVDPPAPPGFDEAAEASSRYVASVPDSFRACFSCGAIRDEGDGLRILPGRLEGRDLVAAIWVAREPSQPVVWAAIDCSGAYAIGMEGRGETVLGRMAARVERLPEEGERCVVIGWPRGEEGRKLYAGTALFTAGGELLAVARQTWIMPRAAA